MPEVCSILFLSNGHGEDIIGASLVRELFVKERNLWIRVLPIVGEGNAYRNLPVKLLGPLRRLPSGGFMRLSLGNFIKDLQGGILGQTYDQIKVLRQVRKEIDVVICVGDVLLVILAGLFVRKPIIFVPTAKSEYISGHYAIEKRIMRKHTSLVLPRDEKTSQVLLAAKIPAIFVGNAMMDSFEIMGKNFGISEDVRVVGILPGSREGAYDEMPTILKVVEYLEGLKVEEMAYLLSLAPQLSLEHLERRINEVGWMMNYTPDLEEIGVNAILTSPTGVQIKVSRKCFGDILARSDIFIGLAGTANEQAVGLGKPVVTFRGAGPQVQKSFIKAQKKLLDDSISVVEPIPEKIATEILVILHDIERYQKMGQIGKERMGPRGAIERMVETILEELKGGFSREMPKS